MVDHSKSKLGKLSPRHDPRTLLIADYIQSTALPPPPGSESWASKVSTWGMMLNDKLGDCTCAAAGHLIRAWTASSGHEVATTDSQIEAAYQAVSGFDPKTRKNDNGAAGIAVLNYWRSNGIGGHKIGAFAALEPRNSMHVQDGIFLFGGIYIGLALPLSAQRQTVWSTPPGGPRGVGAPRSWGGHAVPVIAYDPRGLTCITWGGPKRMTWDFWRNYCDEAYAILSPDFVGGTRPAPNGFDLAALTKDLHRVTG